MDGERIEKLEEDWDPDGLGNLLPAYVRPCVGSVMWSVVLSVMGSVVGSVVWSVMWSVMGSLCSLAWSLLYL